MDLATSNTTDSNYILLEQVVLTSVASLSLLGCLFMIYVYIFISRLEDHYDKLLLALGVSDFLYSAAYLMTAFTNINQDHTLCILEGSMQQYGFNASTFIVCCISINLYASIHGNSNHFEKWRIAYFAASLIIPALMTIWFLSNNLIGVAGLWCFVQMYKAYWVSTILVHGSYFLLAAITLVLSVLSIVEGRRKSSDETSYKKIKWFPLLQLCFVPIILIRQIDHFNPGIFGSAKDTLLLIGGIFACLNGFLNGITYGLNSRTANNSKTSDANDPKITEKLIKHK